MCPGAPPQDHKLTEKEQAGMDRAKWFMGEPLNEGHMGYVIEMRTRPQTIGVAFNGIFLLPPGDADIGGEYETSGNAN
jgi:hypothetical protein